MNVVDEQGDRPAPRASAHDFGARFAAKPIVNDGLWDIVGTEATREARKNAAKACRKRRGDIVARLRACGRVPGSRRTTATFRRRVRRVRRVRSWRSLDRQRLHANAV